MPRLLPHLIKPSTIEFIRQARRTPGFSLFDWLHAYVYARWTHLYIAIGIGEHPWAKPLSRVWGWLERAWPFKHADLSGKPSRGMAETYHGKVVPLEAARQLVMVQEDIRLTNLESIVPYTQARDIILNNPDHIVALECPCRAARANPCLPLDVCLVVGEPFASFIIEHTPQRARWITAQQAVEILQAEDARGHVHHAFFKDAMLGRFYAICNCCACCCGAMQAQRSGTPMLAASGYLAVIHDDECLACGACETSCQFDALSMGAAVMQVDAAKCMGCGVCVGQCPQAAIHLERSPAKGEPLEIFSLMEQAR